jgi:hypothetical protein
MCSAFDPLLILCDWPNVSIRFRWRSCCAQWQMTGNGLPGEKPRAARASISHPANSIAVVAFWQINQFSKWKRKLPNFLLRKIIKLSIFIAVLFPVLFDHMKNAERSKICGLTHSRRGSCSQQLSPGITRFRRGTVHAPTPI